MDLVKAKKDFLQEIILKNVTKVIDQKKNMFKVENLKTLATFHFNDSMEDEHYL